MRTSSAANRSTLGTGLLLLSLFASSCATKRPVEPPLDRDLALETFDRAWTIIHETHFDPDFNGVDWPALREELRPRAAEATTSAELRGILQSMIGRLNQSHFAVIPRDIAESAPIDEGGGDGHPGLELRIVEDRFVVTSVEEEGPAASAGVRPGWVLSRIGDREVDAWIDEIEDATEERGGRYLAYELIALRLSGPPGQAVDLTFLDARDRPVSVVLQLAPPQGEAVKVGNLPRFFAEVRREEVRVEGTGLEVGLIGMNVWMPNIAASFDEAVDAFRDHDGIVIDLRGNPGGLGGMVMGIAGHFLDERVSLGTMTMRSQELRFVANPRLVNREGRRVEPYAGPVAILIDERSASTSEVFAAGMQEVGRSRVFGGRSPGMALPAMAERLPNGDVLYHAIANFTTPSGVPIEGRGVRPDVEVSLRREDLLKGRDPALQAALEWIAERQDGVPRSSMLPRRDRP